VVRDDKREIYSVRYEAVNAMLLNEFLKEHRRVEEQQATIAELRSSADNQRAISTKQDAIIAQQQQQIEALASGLQKVSTAVELNTTAITQVADNR
jgi:methyl-accepting chemotaxis protein